MAGRKDKYPARYDSDGAFIDDYGYYDDDPYSLVSPSENADLSIRVGEYLDEKFIAHTCSWSAPITGMDGQVIVVFSDIFEVHIPKISDGMWRQVIEPELNRIAAQTQRRLEWKISKGVKILRFLPNKGRNNGRQEPS